jgi:hypothetical protein
MDIVVGVVILLALLVFEPGNEEINAYCTAAIDLEDERTSEKFDTRIACWNYYNEYREEIPTL